jgi:hypothetical protein
MFLVSIVVLCQCNHTEGHVGTHKMCQGAFGFYVIFLMCMIKLAYSFLVLLHDLIDSYIIKILQCSLID